MPAPISRTAAPALGESCACALRTNGTAVWQGDDSDGQSSPPSGMSFAQIAAGDSQTCGIAPLGGLERRDAALNVAGARDAWSVNEIMELPRLITAFGAGADGTVYALTQFGPAVAAGE